MHTPSVVEPTAGVGPDRVTHARVFAIAGPAMVANLTTPLLGIVGTAAIGHLGEASLLGAVAMASIVFDFIFWLFGFLRMGTVALTAQALGAGDASERRAVLARALLVAGVIGLALITCQAAVAWAAFGLMAGSAAVTQAARAYFFIRIWSAPFALGNYVLTGWLVGLARAGTALALQIAVNLFNIAATLLLVVGLGLGTGGVALATLLAEIVGFAVGMVVALRLLGGRLGLDVACVFDRARLLRMVVVNRDIMIRTAALIGAFAFFTSQGARAGDQTLAANAVLLNFILIGAFFLDGLAIAAQQLCGRASGASDRPGFGRAVRLVIGWSVAFGLLASAAFVIGGASLIAAMTTSPEVRDAARQFMMIAALAPAAGALAYGFDGIYVGATWTRDMRNLMIAALALYFAAWWAFRAYGNAGLWAALLIFLLARGMLQATRYRTLEQATFGSSRSRQ